MRLPGPQVRIRDVDGAVGQALPVLGELPARPGILIAPSVGEILRTLARASERVTRERAFEVEMAEVQQQELVAGGCGDVAGRLGEMASGSKIRFQDVVGRKDAQLAHSA